jgi:ribose-phosphate pyrophosphokinase
MASLDVQPQPVAPTVLPASYDKRLMVAAGRSSEELGAKIADRIGVSLTNPGLKTFANGEIYCRFEESIRGADIFLIQSTAGNDAAGITANDALIELLIMIDAAVGASAHRVIAVTPWYGYSRQDKKSAPREPITARLVARLLETAGISRLLTMDLHAGQLQGFFSAQTPVDHMTALPMLSQYVKDQLADESNLVIVAPDAGRVKLARRFARWLGAPYALMEKERPAHGVAEIGRVIGDVKGKVAVILDDMIDTGGTLSAAARTVMDEGAREVYAVATHGVFSGNAWETLGNSPLSGIVVTDTIPLREGAPEMIRVLSVADLLTDSIRKIFTDESVSEIFAGENQLF